MTGAENLFDKKKLLNSNIDEKLLVKLEYALNKHDQRSKEPYTGPYHFEKENNLIGLIRNEIDYQLKVDTVGFIGNEELIKILRNNV